MRKIWLYLVNYKTLCIFLSLDTIANYIQARLTPVTPNEAFYLEMAQESFEWGYVTQAPMVIWWVKFGTSWLGNSTIGMRILSIISGLIGKILLWNFIDQNNKQRKQLVFVTILLSLLSLQFFCFLAMMDAAFFMFFSFFLWTLQRYERHNTQLNALLLGLSIALLLYAKYESLISIVLALMVFWTLFIRRSFVLVIASMLCVLLPQIIYNIQHNFIPYQKLLDTYFFNPRNGQIPLRHMMGNLFTYSGFLLLPCSLYIVIVRGSASRFTVLISLLLLLHLILYGILTFYTNMQFWRGGVAISVCVVYLVYTYYLNNQGWQSIMLFNFMLAFTLIVSYRVALSREMYNPFTYTQKYLQQLSFLSTIANGTPVALVDMPHTLALARFYFPQYPFLTCSSSPATISALNQHKYYKPFNDKKVLLVSIYPFAQADTFVFIENKFYYKNIEHFYDKSSAKITPYNSEKYVLETVDTQTFLIAELSVPYDNEKLVNYDSSIALTFKHNTHLNTLHSTYHIQQKHYQNGRALFKIAITLPDPIPEGQKLSLNLNQAGLEIHHNQYYNFEKNKVQALSPIKLINPLTVNLVVP